MRLFVEHPSGKVSTFEVSSTDTIKSLRYRIYASEYIDPLVQRILLEKKQLEDHRTLSDYNIQKDTTVKLAIRLRGGGTPSLTFVNMRLTEELEFSDSAPQWRTVRPGMNLKGICKNTICAANGQVVWVPKDFGIFNMLKECRTAACPACQGPIDDVKNFGIYKCTYSVNGAIKNSEDTTSFNFQDHQANKFKTFIEDENHMDDWVSLIITTKSIPTSWFGGCTVV